MTSPAGIQSRFIGPSHDQVNHRLAERSVRGFGEPLSDLMRRRGLDPNNPEHQAVMMEANPQFAGQTWEDFQRNFDRTTTQGSAIAVPPKQVQVGDGGEQKEIGDARRAWREENGRAFRSGEDPKLENPYSFRPTRATEQQAAESRAATVQKNRELQEHLLKGGPKRGAGTFELRKGESLGAAYCRATGKKTFGLEAERALLAANPHLAEAKAEAEKEGQDIYRKLRKGLVLNLPQSSKKPATSRVVKDVALAEAPPSGAPTPGTPADRKGATRTAPATAKPAPEAPTVPAAPAAVPAAQPATAPTAPATTAAASGSGSSLEDLKQELTTQAKETTSGQKWTRSGSVKIQVPTEKARAAQQQLEALAAYENRTKLRAAIAEATKPGNYRNTPVHNAAFNAQKQLELIRATGLDKKLEKLGLSE